jgi:hypothetical protein
MSNVPATINQTENAPQCSCDYTAIRRRVLSHGVATYVVQCLGCGRQIRSVKKDSYEVRMLADVLPFDDTLQRTWRDGQRRFYEARQEARAHEQATKQTDWWLQYTAYLKTTAWRLKRQAVMTRANNWCEGCAARQATQVHHKTYEHMGNELLFELVAVCDTCHHILHPEMD